MSSYYQKYLKYKNKYLELKKSLGISGLEPQMGGNLTEMDLFTATPLATETYGYHLREGVFDLEGGVLNEEEKKLIDSINDKITKLKNTPKENQHAIRSEIAEEIITLKSVKSLSKDARTEIVNLDKKFKELNNAALTQPSEQASPRSFGRQGGTTLLKSPMDENGNLIRLDKTGQGSQKPPPLTKKSRVVEGVSPRSS